MLTHGLWPGRTKAYPSYQPISGSGLHHTSLSPNTHQGQDERKRERYAQQSEISSTGAKPGDSALSMDRGSTSTGHVGRPADCRSRGTTGPGHPDRGHRGPEGPALGLPAGHGCEAQAPGDRAPGHAGSRSARGGDRPEMDEYSIARDQYAILLERWRACLRAAPPGHTLRRSRPWRSPSPTSTDPRKRGRCTSASSRGVAIRSASRIRRP